MCEGADELVFTPLKPGAKVRVKLLAAQVEVWQERERIARHERCYERSQQVLTLEHYLEVLGKKPSALAGSTALVQWCERGLWPESFDRLWSKLRERHGKQEGTREMIDLLLASKAYGWAGLRRRTEEALALGCTDATAVKHLLQSGSLELAPRVAVDIGQLRCYERRLPEVGHYDALLGAQ
jgi:hypothetical protein